MARFIDVHGDFINIEDIRKVEHMPDDIYLGLFPQNAEQKIIVDYIPFTFAKIHTFLGEEIDLDIDLYPPEEDEDVEGWINRNRSYINQSITTLKNTLGEIIEITGFEYKDV